MAFITDLFPFAFHVSSATLAGITLWSLALYLAFFPTSERLTDRLAEWMGEAERSLYISVEEYEKTRVNREAQNAFFASLLSIAPFLVLGGLLNWAIEASLDGSWSISTGISACIGCGLYELGRRDGQSAE
jgi:hypothetical protein